MGQHGFKEKTMALVTLSDTGGMGDYNFDYVGCEVLPAEGPPPPAGNNKSQVFYIN
jgi:hypothetical protein